MLARLMRGEKNACMRQIIMHPTGEGKKIRVENVGVNKIDITYLEASESASKREIHKHAD